MKTKRMKKRSLFLMALAAMMAYLITGCSADNFVGYTDKSKSKICSMSSMPTDGCFTFECRGRDAGGSYMGITYETGKSFSDITDKSRIGFDVEGLEPGKVTLKNGEQAIQCSLGDTTITLGEDESQSVLQITAEYSGLDFGTVYKIDMSGTAGIYDEEGQLIGIFPLSCGTKWMQTVTEDGKAPIHQLEDTDIYWELDGDALKISGTGAIPDFDSATSSAWKGFSDVITSVEISSGITAIGKYSFADYDQIREIAIGENVESINDMAFNGCTSLKYVTFPAGLKSLGDSAFCNCKELDRVTFKGNNVDEIDSFAFDGVGESGKDKTILILPEGFEGPKDNKTSWYRGFFKTLYGEVHIHDLWTYSAEKNTLTATCGNEDFKEKCDLANNSVPLTLAVTSSSVFATPNCWCKDKELSFVLEGSDDWEANIGTVPTIYYEGITASGEKYASDKKPEELGEYEASISYGNEKAVYDFEIIDHIFGDWVNADSSKHSMTCSNCDHSVTEECKDSLVSTEKVAATCDKMGCKAYYKCSKCDALYADAEGKVKTSLISLIEAAKGHTWNDDYTVDVEATTTAEGSKSIHCAICNAVKKGSEVSIPKIGAVEPIATPSSVPSATATPVPSGAPDATATPVPNGASGATPTAKPSGNPASPVEPTAKPSVTVYKPAKVQIVSAKNNKKKTITIKFKAAKNAKKYKVQYATDKKFKKVKTITVKKLKITLKKLKKKTYYIRICGINGNEKGLWSRVKKVKVKK